MAFRYGFSFTHNDPLLTTPATVINGVISLPIAILAYFFLPDTPGTAKPNWLFSERVSIMLPINQYLGTIGAHILSYRKSNLLRREWEGSDELPKANRIQSRPFSATSRVGKRFFSPSSLVSLPQNPPSEMMSLLFSNSNATFWKPTCHLICLLAESTQQKGQTFSLYRRANSMLLHLILVRYGPC
jgi:hypothetical protein